MSAVETGFTINGIATQYATVDYPQVMNYEWYWNWGGMGGYCPHCIDEWYFYPNGNVFGGQCIKGSNGVVGTLHFTESVKAEVGCNIMQYAIYLDYNCGVGNVFTSNVVAAVWVNHPSPTGQPTGQPTGGPTVYEVTRLHTLPSTVDLLQSLIIADVAIPKIATFNDTYFLANYGGIECIMVMSRADYDTYGLKPHYISIYSSALKQHANHTSFTFSDYGVNGTIGGNGTIAVLSSNGLLEVSFDHGRSFNRSKSLYLGVASIKLFGDGVLGFVVANQTIFNVPWFYVPIGDALSA